MFPETQPKGDAKTSSNGSPANIALLLKQLTTLAKPLGAFAEIRAQSAEAPRQIRSALAGIPSGTALGAEIERIRIELDALVDAQLSADRDNIGRALANFIAEIRDTGTLVREVSNGWRIGQVLLDVNRDAATAGARYTTEELVPQSPIGDSAHLHQILARANELLASGLLTTARQEALFNRAYDYAVGVRRGANVNKPELVPLDEFYRECRSATIGIELIGKSPDRQVKAQPLPKWAFLYNLDKFRSDLRSVPANRRFVMHTGSQSETRSPKAMTLNGLSPRKTSRSFALSNEPKNSG